MLQDYLDRFKEFILTANGLGMTVGSSAESSEQGTGAGNSPLAREGERGSTVLCQQQPPIKAA